MPAPDSRRRIEQIACQWHDLAERRLAAYIDLYRSGRWTHYYRNQEEFAARMLEVIKVAKAFRELAGRPIEAAPRQEGFRTAA